MSVCVCLNAKNTRSKNESPVFQRICRDQCTFIFSAHLKSSIFSFLIKKEYIWENVNKYAMV